MSKASQKSASRAQAPVNPSGPVVRRSSAMLLAVLMLLAGVFLGWQGAVVVFNQGGAPVTAPGAGQGQGTPPGMPPGMGQGAAPGGQQQGGNPMTSGLMAQAKALEARAAQNPNDPAAWAELGHFYFDSDLPDRAVVCYQKSLELKADQPDIWTDMGVMLRSQRTPQEALNAFAQALGYNPRHEIAQLNTGIVLLFDMNDRAGAAKAWQGLVKQNPEAKMPDGKRVADALKELGLGTP